MNRWDQRYASGDYGGRSPEALLVQLSLMLPPGQALDLGCGDGRHSRLLASRRWRVTAVDYSSEALSCIGEEPYIQKVLADLEQGEFVIEPETYDLIVDTCFLWRPLFPSIRAGIKKGGVFAGVFPLSGISREYLLEPGELAALFSGWEFLHSSESAERAELLARKP